MHYNDFDDCYKLSHIYQDVNNERVCGNFRVVESCQVIGRWSVVFDGTTNLGKPVIRESCDGLRREDADMLASLYNKVLVS